MTFAVDRIEEIYRTWRLQHDALKIVRREVLRQSKSLDSSRLRLHGTEFEEAQPESIDHDIQACQQSIADFTVLSMWTVFERLIIERLENECKKMQLHPYEAFNEGVTRKVVNTVEYWKIDEMLDLLALIAGSRAIGQAKQIKRYRDWIAHQNPRKSSPGKIDPTTAKTILVHLAQMLETDRTRLSVPN